MTQPQLTDSMRAIGETLMNRWGVNAATGERYDETGEKRDTIQALLLLFPEASDGQISIITSMAHGRCHEDDVAEIRNA